MGASENVARIQNGYEAFNRGDVETMRDGKVTDARHFVDDQAALDAFLA